MAFTKNTDDLNIIQALADLPNDTDGLTPAQLKAKFDEAVNLLKTYLNDTLIAELESTTDGSSGADRIGATALNAFSGETVQAILEYLKTQVDGVVLGEIPDNSLTNAKLGTDIKIGSLATLTTTEKSNVVGAINEIDGEIVTVATPNKLLKLNSNSKLPASITGDADTLDGLHATDLQLKTNTIYFTENRSYTSYEEYTKTIALGGTYKAGTAFFVSASNIYQGGIAQFTTNQNRGASVGTSGSTSYIASFKIKADAGTVSGGDDNKMLGSASLSIKSMYLEGTNLVIIIKNSYGGSVSSNYKCEVQVWG